MSHSNQYKEDASQFGLFPKVREPTPSESLSISFPDSKIPDLKEMTGLPPKYISRTLVQNPRSYMNLRGAAAEVHLQMLLDQARSEAKILDYSESSSDVDKDFSLKLVDGGTSIVECKNVEVMKLRKEERIDYIGFLVREGYISENDMLNLFDSIKPDLNLSRSQSRSAENIDELTNLLSEHYAMVSEGLLKESPQWARESGYPRYHFSASRISQTSVANMDESDFLNQFEQKPTVDFQKTRNTKDNSADRFYLEGEIDILAACMFSRTLQWEFLFCHDLPLNDEHPGRYSNKVTLSGKVWFSDLLECINSMRAS